MFLHTSRGRLTDKDLGRFPGQTLFDRIARAACHAGCLPRKELYEAWEVARRVRRLFRGGRIVDLGGGHGLLAGALLLLDDSSPNAIVVDPALPPSCEKLHGTLVAAWPRLAGRVAFVTGAARGIGRAIALALADAGADVAVADLHPAPFRGEPWYRLRERRSGPDEDTPTVRAVAALGRRSLEIAVDVADPDAVLAAAALCHDELGPVDILVNNAGIVNNIASLATMTPESWAHEVQVNLNGMFHTVRAFVPAMAERGWGRVVNISSVAAVQPGLGQPAYTASKAGVIGLTRAVAQEFGPGGVTANAILPGLIATPLVRSMPEHLRAAAIAQVPVHRLGEPADIAALAVFLASPAASFVTGVEIPCDGGLLHAPLGGLATAPPARG